MTISRGNWSWCQFLLVKGTARPHRMKKAEPKPVVAVPEPPNHLDEEARESSPKWQSFWPGWP
jgi:hypothetical protein